MARFRFGVPLAILLGLAAVAQAQLGMGDGAVPGELGDALAQRIAAATRYGRKPKITLIDNLFFGISGMDELKKHFESKGWEAVYREDTYVSELYRAAQTSDVLYIVTHAGVRERDQQVGFVWRTLLGLNKNVITADEVREAMQGHTGPALVVVAGCQAAQNESMARAFGGALAGFPVAMDPTSAASWCTKYLRRIADGSTYRQAFAETPYQGNFLSGFDTQPRLIEPVPEQ